MFNSKLEKKLFDLERKVNGLELDHQNYVNYFSKRIDALSKDSNKAVDNRLRRSKAEVIKIEEKLEKILKIIKSKKREKKEHSNKEVINRVGKICNVYGGLEVKTIKGRFFWNIHCCFGDAWEEISETLYNELLRHNNK